jgi:hypothetical protein
MCTHGCCAYLTWNRLDIIQPQRESVLGMNGEPSKKLGTCLDQGASCSQDGAAVVRRHSQSSLLKGWLIRTPLYKQLSLAHPSYHFCTRSAKVLETHGLAVYSRTYLDLKGGARPPGTLAESCPSRSVCDASVALFGGSALRMKN